MIKIIPSFTSGIIFIIVLFAQSSCYVTDMPFVSHQFKFNINNGAYSSVNVQYSTITTLLAPYDNTYDRFIALAGLWLAIRDTISCNLQLGATSTSTSQQVLFDAFSWGQFKYVSYYLLFVKQGTSMYWGQAQYRTLQTINNFGTSVIEETWTVTTPTTFNNTTEITLVPYFFRVISQARGSQSPGCILTTYSLNSSNTVMLGFTAYLDENLKKIALTLIYINTTSTALENLATYRYTGILDSSTLLTVSFFNNIPGLYSNSVFGGYDGYCLIGIRGLQIAKGNAGYLARYFLFNATTNPVSQSYNYIQPGDDFQIILEIICAKPCPYSSYFYDITQFCYFCMTNCLECTSISNCQLCIATYGWDSSNLNCDLCSNIIPNCQFCLSDSNCTSCTNDTYVLNGTIACMLCSAPLEGCLTCSSPSICTLCINDTYALVLNNTCALCSFLMDYCITCSSSSACTSCLNNSYAVNSTNLCQLCSELMSECQTCSSALICLTCYNSSYILLPNNTACPLCSLVMEGCFTCSSTTICTDCVNSTYSLEANNSCVPCSHLLSDCVTCINNNICTSCINDTLAVNSLNKCQLCLELMTACQTCSSYTFCTSCTNDTYVLNGTIACMLCSAPLEGCLTCSSPSICTLCINDTYALVLNNTCALCSFLMDYCITCSSSSACTSCLNNSYAVNSTNLCQLCSELLPFCLTCSNNTFCSLCYNDSYFFNYSSLACELCSSAIDNCYNCNDSTTCTQCSSPTYFVNPTFSCSLCSSLYPQCLECSHNASMPSPEFQACDICNETFFWNGGGPACYFCPSVTGTCLTCLSSTYCYSCVNDSLGLSGSNFCDPCPVLISECELCVNSSYCKQCVNQSYYLALQNVLCLPCYTSLPNCQTCQGSSICLSCASVTHYIDQTSSCSLCQAVLPNCLECLVAIGVSSANCTLCATNFLINSTQKCQSCSVYMLNCIDCVTSNYCDQCINFHGFDPQSNSCLPCGAIYNRCTGCSNVYCLNCNDEMRITNDRLGCECIVGWVVQGLCTIIVGCTEPVIYDDGRRGCVLCNSTTFFALPVDDICVCLEGTLLEETCNTVMGCLTANGTSRCSLCNISKDLQPAPNSEGICICQVLFKLEAETCVDICGDGLLARKVNNNCDDGNLIEGDGCSSKCLVENSYRCENGTTTTPSACVYAGIPIVLQENRVQKSEGLNQGVFQFNVIPPLISISRMNIQNYVDFFCDSSFTISEISYNSGILKVIADYSTDMESKTCNITMSFEPLLIDSVSYTLSFTAVSKTSPLTISTQLDTYATFNTVFLYLSYAVLLAFLLSLGHKMIGAELLFSCQMVYFSCGLYQQPPLLTTSIGKFKAVTGSLFFQDENYQTLFEPFSNQVELSPFFLENTLVVSALLLLFFAIWVILSVFKHRKTEKIENNSIVERRTSKKLPSKWVRAPCFIFNVFLFPLTAGFLVVIFLSASINNTRLANKGLGVFPSTLSNLAQLLVWIISAFVVSIESIHVSTLRNAKKRGEVFGMGGFSGVKKWYISLFLTRCILAAWVLSLYMKSAKLLLVGILLSSVVLSLVLFLKVRPYQSKINNLGFILCELTSCCSLSLPVLAQCFVLDDSYWQMIVVFLFIMITVSTLVSLIRSVIALVNRVRGSVTQEVIVNRNFENEGREIMERGRKQHKVKQLSKQLVQGREAGVTEMREVIERQNQKGGSIDSKVVPKRPARPTTDIEDELLTATKKRLRQDFLQYRKKIHTLTTQ